MQTMLTAILNSLLDLLSGKRAVRLSERDSKVFLESLGNPPKSNKNLESAFKEPKEVNPEKNYKVTRAEVLMGRDKDHPLNDDQNKNLNDLLAKINIIRDIYGKPMSVSSGYRPAAINANVGGAANSTHTLCQAVDIRDPNGQFREWCLKNLQLFKDNGLWLEDFRWTPTWVHIQTRPASRRVFIPFNPAVRPPTAPDMWSGTYDRSMD